MGRVATDQELLGKRNTLKPGNVQGIFFFESGKIDILKKSQGKYKEFNMADLGLLKAEIVRQLRSLSSQ